MSLDEEDIDIFFATADFARLATYTPVVGAAKEIEIIFDAPFSMTSAQGIDYQSDVPVATCRTSDVQSVTEGDTLTIDAVVLKIVDVQPDGTGITRLTLSKD